MVGDDGGPSFSRVEVVREPQTLSLSVEELHIIRRIVDAVRTGDVPLTLCQAACRVGVPQTLRTWAELLEVYGQP